MNRSIITTSQNIKGDISTCTVQSTEVNSGRTTWVQYKTTVMVNNCTGETKEYQNWELSGQAFGLVMVGICAVVLLLTFVASMFAPNNDPFGL